MMSRPTDRRRSLGGHRGRAGSAAVVVCTVVLSVLMALGTGVAVAFWSATGSGSALAETGTLASPVDVTAPGTAKTEVALDWTPGVGGVNPEGYYVTRHTAEGSNSPATVDPACSSTPTDLLTGTSCVDSVVPDGEFTYVVTAVHKSWTAHSAPSGPVTVVNASQLGFVIQPTTVAVDEPMSPAFTVAVQSADGESFAVSGAAVTVAIESGPAGGTLAGIITVNTDADGVATFPGVSIDQAGVGYTLSATSPGLTPATSESFAVVLPPLLGAAGDYSVLAWTAVVNTGTSSVSGDVGVSPGTSVTGFGAGDVGGDIHAGDADAAGAQQAMASAYEELAGLPADEELVGDLGGRTLTTGTYHSTAAIAVTGQLTLDAEGDPDAVFVFQGDAAFNTAAASRVNLVNGAQASHVFWVITGAAGTGADSFLSGTILSQGAITLGAGTVLTGRALSRGTVTLAANIIRFTTAPPPTVTIEGGATAVTDDVTAAITGTSSAPASSPVTVTIAGQTLSTTVQLDGTWTVTTNALAAGTHSIVAKVRAPTGDGATASQTLTVEVNPPTVTLGAARTYSVLATTAVVNTGVTHLSGDLGVSPSDSVSGFGPSEGGTLDGTIHAGDAVAAEARVDLLAALDDASTRAAHTQIPGELGGRTFHVGVHHATTALAVTGTVTLDGQGDPNAVFIFQTDAAFNTAASSSVNLIGGAQADHVFWVVTGAAGTGANSSLAGALLARGAITLGSGTTLSGQALSLGTVTLAQNVLTGVAPAPTAQMAAGAAPSDSTSGTPTDEPAPAPPAEEAISPEPSPAPEPSSAPEPSPAPEPSHAPDTPDIPATVVETASPTEPSGTTAP
jgi:hypothetical protein